MKLQPYMIQTPTECQWFALVFYTGFINRYDQHVLHGLGGKPDSNPIAATLILVRTGEDPRKIAIRDNPNLKECLDSWSVIPLSQLGDENCGDWQVQPEAPLILTEARTLDPAYWPDEEPA